MGGWTENVERRAAIIFDQMAAARALAIKFGDDPFDLTEPYRAMLNELYGDQMPLAHLLDRADLTAWFEGKAVRSMTPSVGIVNYACLALRQQIQQIAKAMIGLTADARPDWSPDLELGLSGLARGSLVIGVQLQAPHEITPGETGSLLDETDPVYQAVRAAVRSIARVAQYLTDKEVVDSIQEAFPDPAVRDTVLVATHKLAPTGRRGIDQITFYSEETQGAPVNSLTPSSRKILARAVAKPLSEARSMTFDGTVRAIDLDARRFEVRGVHGEQAVRCLYNADMDRQAQTWLNQRIRVSGNGECGVNGLPRLLLAESITVQKASDQPTLPLQSSVS